MQQPAWKATGILFVYNQRSRANQTESKIAHMASLPMRHETNMNARRRNNESGKREQNMARQDARHVGGAH
jgi:hypothetical protein